jgi:hypothetical protein
MTRLQHWAELQADVDMLFNADDTVDMWNQRIRRLIRHAYNKPYLSADKLNLFDTWAKRVDKLPMTATRFQLFSVAPLECLFIMGY